MKQQADVAERRPYPDPRLNHEGRKGRERASKNENELT